jgi:Protein of unknown function (DUF5672)
MDSIKLRLPSVSLAMQETRETALACLAIEECVSKVDFAEVLVFTDKPDEFMKLDHLCNLHIVITEDWPTKVDWCKFNWFGTQHYIKTSHAVFIQWDSWVWDQAMWHDDYLKYDYAGSPWWYSDKRNVGNSGFSMKSARLMRYIYKHRDQFPCNTNIEDDLLCRGYRPALEEAGFIWTPERLAKDFSFELMRPSETSRHFGFHGMFNWHIVLDEDKILERAEIAYRSDYIRARMWQSFRDRNPAVAQRFAA